MLSYCLGSSSNSVDVTYTSDIINLMIWIIDRAKFNILFGSIYQKLNSSIIFKITSNIKSANICLSLVFVDCRRENFMIFEHEIDLL